MGVIKGCNNFECKEFQIQILSIVIQGRNTITSRGYNWKNSLLK